MSRYIELPLTVHEIKGDEDDEDDGAIKVEAENGTVAWLPRIAIEDNGDGTFTLRESLALDKGLI